MDPPKAVSPPLATAPVSSHNNIKPKRAECTCKYLQLNLSTTTAAEYGDLASLTHRLSSSDENNTKIQIIPGNTPLHLSAQHGHATMTSYLLKNGYDPNTGVLSRSSALPQSSPHQNKDRYPTPTPLHRACYSGALGCIQLLLDAHADILIPDVSFGDGMNAMHKAVKGGRPLAVILLLNYLKSPSSPPSLRTDALANRDSNNRTPLQIARESANKGPDEISSLRRWDKVAGGSDANFEECARLLEREEAEIDGRSGGEGEEEEDAVRTDGTMTSTSTSSLFRKDGGDGGAVFELSCDCDEEIVGGDGVTDTRQCKTAVWEAAFTNALFKSTMATLAPMTQHRQKNSSKYKNVRQNKTIESQNLNDGSVGSQTDLMERAKEESQVAEDEKTSQELITSTVLNQGVGITMESYRSNSLPHNVTNDSTMIKTGNTTTKVIGQPCSNCAKKSLTLFRDGDGNLVCRSCLKRIRVRR